MTDVSRREAWDRVTGGPLVAVGVAYIAAYSVIVLVPDLPSGWTGVLVGVITLTWVVFIVDVVVQVALTPRGQRVRFVLRHPIEVLSMALPVFRAMKVVDLFHRVPYLDRRTGSAVRTRFVLSAASYAIVFIYFTALATLHVERGAPGATIVNFGDAIWWAIVTVATVGYGDLVPVTFLGRLYAVFLMIGGIAIVGTASATFVSVLSDRIARLRGHDPDTREHDREPRDRETDDRHTDDRGPRDREPHEKEGTR